MYSGLIIVFNTFEKEAFKKALITAINAIAETKICLVCNSSNDEVFEILTEVAERCNNTNVINTKREKSSTSAVRAGARYMFNEYNLKYLGFIVDLYDFEILKIMKQYAKRQEAIVTLNKIERDGKTVKQTFYQSLFSVTEYLRKIASSSIL